MKHLALLLFAASAFAQTSATIAEAEFLSPIGANKKFRGTLTVSLQRGCRLTRNGQPYPFAARTYCIGLGPNGAATPAPSNCEETSAEGVVDIKLVPTGSGTTPEGCSYIVNSAYRRVDGTTVNDTETWVVNSIGPYRIADVRTSVLPTPSARIRYSQIDWTGFGNGCIQVVNGSATPVSCSAGTTPRTWDQLTETWDELTMAWDDL